MIFFLTFTAIVIFSQFFSDLLAFILKKCFTHHNEKIDIKNEIENLSKQLELISIVDDFAKYSKLKRKLNTLQDEYKSTVLNDQKKQTSMKFKWVWPSQILLNMFISALIYFFWNEPLLQLNDKWFFPVQNTLSMSVQPGQLGILPWYAIVKSTTSTLKTVLSFEKKHR